MSEETRGSLSDSEDLGRDEGNRSQSKLMRVLFPKPDKKMVAEGVVAFAFLLILAHRGQIMVPYGIIATAVFLQCFVFLMRRVWLVWDRRREYRWQIAFVAVLAAVVVALDVISLELLFKYTNHS